MLACWFAACRRNWLCSVLMVALQVIGLAQYFVVVLKGSVIMPGDLFALGTAAAVGSNLRFQMGAPALDAITLTYVGLALLAHVMPVRAQLRCIADAARREVDEAEERSNDADHSSLDHVMKTYQTNYLVWANYDVAGNEQISEERNLSLNYLGTLMGLEAGLPLTNHQRALAGLMGEVPAVTPIASRGPIGPWYKTDDRNAPFAGAIHDLEQINYLEFGSKV